MSDLRQLHSHEDSAHEERHEDADERDAQEEDPVEFGCHWLVGLVEDHEAQPAHGE